MTGLNEMIQASIMHKFPISPQQLANRYLQSNHTGNTDIEINKYRNSNLRHFITECFPLKVIRWAYFPAIYYPFQQLVSKVGWACFHGWTYYREITVWQDTIHLVITLISEL